jgi:pyruvate/2-oxoglutarate dehydrogenase complex dihydrolipoamide acyltransferase (E2) component
VVRLAPIIDPPQAAILGVGAIKKKYTTDEKGNLK